MEKAFLEGICPIEVHVEAFQSSIEKFLDKPLRIKNIQRNINKKGVLKAL